MTDYKGIFKTNSDQKFLMIQWVRDKSEKDVSGTTQNVKVKLERYSGDASIFPETTEASI